MKKIVTSSVFLQALFLFRKVFQRCDTSVYYEQAPGLDAHLHVGVFGVVRSFTIILVSPLTGNGMTTRSVFATCVVMISFACLRLFVWCAGGKWKHIIMLI